MTYEDAYAEGFCKAAEAIGVNPIMLAKRAGAKEWGAAQVGRILGGLGRAKGALRTAKDTAAKGGRRYLELLMGGKPGLGERVMSGLGDDAAAAMQAEVGVGLPTAGSWGQRLRAALKTRGRRIAGARGELPSDVTEARKALATQLGTGLGLAGAGTGAAMLATRDKPKTPYEKLLAALGLA